MGLITRILIFVALKRRIWLLGALLPGLLVAALGIPRIDFQDGLRSVFNSDSEVFETYLEHSSAFSPGETDVLLLAEMEDALDGPSLAALRDFVLDLQFIEGVETVQSVFSLRQWNPARQTLVPLIPFDLAERDALDQALDAIDQQRDRGIALVSKDRRKTVIVISLGGEMTDLHGPDRPLVEIRNLIRLTEDQSDLRLKMTGLLTARDEIISGLRSDQFKINLLGAIFGFILSIILFRSITVAVLNSLVPISALVVSLGLFGWLGFSINALTNALPVLVLVLASSDSIHMTFDLRRRLAEGLTVEQAISRCLRDMAGPVILTSLTTIIAFSSLFFSDSPIVRELALTGCAGVFVALLTVLFMHPLVFGIACRFTFLRALIANPPRLKPAPTPETKTAGRKNRIIAIGGIALAALAFSILWPVQPTYRFMENVDKRSEVAIVLAEVEAIAGPFSTLDLPVRFTNGGDLDDATVQKELALLSDQLGAIQGVQSVLSLADVANATGGWGNIQNVLGEMPDHLRQRLISKSGDRLVIALRVFDTGSADIQTLAKDVSDALAGLKLQSLQVEDLTGFLLMSAVLSDAMIKQLSESFLLAALLCPILIGLWFRRFDFGLFAILPNVLPIALVAAGLTLVDLDIQLTAALAMTIAFGIALDDSIHVFNRVHLNRADGISAAIHIVRPVLITTTLILSAGLAATQFSSMPTVRFFGLLCVAVFFFALICDLVLLPAMLKLGRRSTP